MVSWPAKDPDAVFDYRYTIPLDASDSIASHTFTRLSGTVNVGSESLASAPATNSEGTYGQDLTVWLSGGANGEIDVFRIAWVTAAGREDDDVITLAVIESDIVEPLALTGHAKPAPGHFTARYPAFAAVAAETIQYWLTDAERYVGTNWIEGDYAAGLMSLAAHNMALAGLGSAATLNGAPIPAGVTRLKSGSFELGMTEAAANLLVTGGYGATRYGLEFKMLLRRNAGGPLVQDTGAVPAYDYLPGYRGGAW